MAMDASWDEVEGPMILMFVLFHTMCVIIISITTSSGGSSSSSSGSSSSSNSNSGSTEISIITISITIMIATPLLLWLLRGRGAHLAGGGPRRGAGAPAVLPPGHIEE